MNEQEHFQRGKNHDTYIQPEDWPRVDELVDRLIGKEQIWLQDGEFRQASQ